MNWKKPTEYRFEDDLHIQRMPQSHNHDHDVSPLDFIAQKQGHLSDDLLEQVQYLPIRAQEQTILQYLILNLDDNGYLPLTTTEIADQLHINDEKMEHAISLLHQLEPIGIGARNMTECLLLQAKHHYPDNPHVALVIKNHLEELADKKWKSICEALDITKTDVREIAELIASLNPRPCTGLFSTLR